MEHYIIWPAGQKSLPNNSEVKQNTELVNTIKLKAPHLLKPIKRQLPKASISWTKSLFFGDDYPFKNGKQVSTKGCIVWTDYQIKQWPLLLFILNNAVHQSFEEGIVKYFLDADLNSEPNWDEIRIIFKKCKPIRNINTDELDRWYDEISTTHIHPESYHDLYHWFGLAVRDIGYFAFDIFMKKRNGSIAWGEAIKAHLDNIPNLPVKIKNMLMGDFFIGLINR
ncbi:hypothetical protein [Carboxylicivirga marina]|uniref:Uncharacterized protein n=1 Tax=Carboxylicivirga marina TaxID=2800988 RepID=A0ABS1HNE7_9BACT|nr:hypothetical protein [Carboxylicivirga marina]MBK3518689.1 hypothetical protein [Carboxylicivirga marina]